MKTDVIDHSSKEDFEGQNLMTDAETGSKDDQF